MGYHEDGGDQLKRFGFVCGVAGSTPLNRTVVAFFAITLCKSSPARSLDNLSLLTGTLMTHKKIGCAEKPISLNCPADTNVVIKSARYSNFSTNVAVQESSVKCDRYSPNGDDANVKIQSSDNIKKCRWRDSLQYSLLQTAVEACRSKQKCLFQISPSKFGIEACLEEAAFVEIDYNCRPASFSSKVGCEHEKISLECGPFTRLAIFAASYGRTQYQSVQCPQPQGVAEETCLLSYATEIVIGYCHGKRKCLLVVDAKTFGSPCKEKSRIYLKVVYACVPKQVLSKKYEEEAAESEERDESNPFDKNRFDLDSVVDNEAESSAPSLNLSPGSGSNAIVGIGVERSANETESYKDVAVLLHRTTSDDARNSSSDGAERKFYMYLAGSILGSIILLVSFAAIRFIIWKRRKMNTKSKFHNVAINKSLSQVFSDQISEVDADVTLAEVSPATITAVIPTSSPCIFSSYRNHDHHHHHFQDFRHIVHDHPHSHCVTNTKYVTRPSLNESQNDSATLQVVRYGKDDIIPRSLSQDINSQFYYD